MVEPNATIRPRSGKSYALLAIVLTALGSANSREVRAGFQNQVQREPDSSEPLVIQGRIIEMKGAFVTVKTPEGYPGGPGVHAQFVIAGPIFKVDVSRARVLLPDGKQSDKLPLAVDDRVLMVLSRSASAATVTGSPPNVDQIYFALIIERIAQTDRIITH